MKETIRNLELVIDSSSEIEQCGIVLKDGSVIPSKNLHEKPETGFRVDPVLLVKHADRLAATWHSHPDGPANLSQADYLCFLQWPNLTHYIFGVDGVRVFLVDDGLVVEVSID